MDELQAAFLGAQARLDVARKQLADRTVKAPFAGVVGIRRVDVGARVDDDTVLTTLDDLSEVEIEFSVPEIFFGRVRQGQTVSATSAAFPGRAFSGRIVTVDTRIGAVSRAFRVRAILPNPDLVLHAGMFMHVEVVLEERPAVDHAAVGQGRVHPGQRGCAEDAVPSRHDCVVRSGAAYELVEALRHPRFARMAGVSRPQSRRAAPTPGASESPSTPSCESPRPRP